MGVTSSFARAKRPSVYTTPQTRVQNKHPKRKSSPTGMARISSTGNPTPSTARITQVATMLKRTPRIVEIIEPKAENKDPNPEITRAKQAPRNTTPAMAARIPGRTKKATNEPISIKESLIIMSFL